MRGREKKEGLENKRREGGKNRGRDYFQKEAAHAETEA